ncbi:hypothetical protein SNOG_03645 [Parastagonospora nodorum SN15]|uniref:Uncharacterized protein n=1 Tax=Phaeosphaeria nodorum (strain SN15 / ATCC MYA-4574 / FGSC 10173) TaxID=321614 RepID=Q0UX69_PHANO|nr:hypothetical protein SNOG_03645 [Parastagonospora nodorum SN15]EAT88850.1 hypothetical protein SNOG_03645 [Parastagonospora nodorum SN15]
MAADVLRRRTEAVRNRSREDAEKGAFDKEARDRSTGLFRVIAPTVSNVCASQAPGTTTIMASTSSVHGIWK